MNHVNLLLCQAGPGLATKESLQFFALWCEKCCEKLTKLNFFDSHLEKLCCCFQNYFLCMSDQKNGITIINLAMFLDVWKNHAGALSIDDVQKQSEFIIGRRALINYSVRIKKVEICQNRLRGPLSLCTVYQNSFSGALSSLRWGKGLWDEIYTVPK